MAMRRQKSTISMDNKQRISLTGVLSKEERINYSSFRIYRDEGRIVLEPVAIVPEKDHWIYRDKQALDSLMKGIKDAEEGRLQDLGSFAKYAKDDED